MALSVVTLTATVESAADFSFAAGQQNAGNDDGTFAISLANATSTTGNGTFVLNNTDAETVTQVTATSAVAFGSATVTEGGTTDSAVQTCSKCCCNVAGSFSSVDSGWHQLC